MFSIRYILPVGVFCFLICTPIFLSAQSKIYYSRQWNELKKGKEKKDAYIVRSVESLGNGQYTQVDVYATKDKIEASRKTFKDIELSIPDGRCETWHSNGKQKSLGLYKDGHKVGEWKFYYRNGKLHQKGNFYLSLPNSVWERYDDDGNLIEKTTYAKGIKQGNNVRYYPDGNIWYEAIYSNGELNLNFRSYYEDGTLAREEFYNNGELVEKKCLSSTGEEIPHFPFYSPPIFGECESAENAIFQKLCSDQNLILEIQENISYPERPKFSGIEGIALVHFTISKEGKVGDILVINELCEEIEYTCTRLIRKLGKWKPAKMDGKLAEVGYMLPVSFRLQ